MPPNSVKMIYFSSDKKFLKQVKNLSRINGVFHLSLIAILRISNKPRTDKIPALRNKCM